MLMTSAHTPELLNQNILCGWGVEGYPNGVAGFAYQTYFYNSC